MEMEWKIILGIGGVLAVLITFFQAGKWVGNVNSDRTNFEEFMSEIRDDIKAIRDDVKEICNTFTSQFDIEYKSDKVDGTGREGFKIYQRERMGNKGCERIV